MVEFCLTLIVSLSHQTIENNIFLALVVVHTKRKGELPFLAQIRFVQHSLQRQRHDWFGRFQEKNLIKSIIENFFQRHNEIVNNILVTNVYKWWGQKRTQFTTHKSSTNCFVQMHKRDEKHMKKNITRNLDKNKITYIWNISTAEYT